MAFLCCTSPDTKETPHVGVHTQSKSIAQNGHDSKSDIETIVLEEPKGNLVRSRSVNEAIAEEMVRLSERVGGVQCLPIKDLKLRLQDGNGNPFVIGKGSCGPVYHGSLNGQECVVKPIHTKDQTKWLSFLWEAKIVGAVQCQNIGRYLGFCKCKEGVLLLIEHIQGCTLKDLLEKNDEFRWHNRGKEVMLSVAAALNVLSLNGITHGGIKASNVIVKSSGEAILTDTGLHKLMKADSDMKENPESFAFAAPEEFKEGKGESGKGGKGDSWSFGTLLHQVCTGEKPPRHRALRPIKVPEEASQKVADLIELCHRMDPNKRPKGRQIHVLMRQL